MQLAQPGGEIHIAIRGHGTGGDKPQAVAKGVDDTPSGAPQSGVNADDSNRLLHETPYLSGCDPASDK
ncbi:hypothetical protein D3C79_1074250 [compost metagenome]